MALPKIGDKDYRGPVEGAVGSLLEAMGVGHLIRAGQAATKPKPKPKAKPKAKVGGNAIDKKANAYAKSVKTRRRQKTTAKNKLTRSTNVKATLPEKPTKRKKRLVSPKRKKSFGVTTKSYGPKNVADVTSHMSLRSQAGQERTKRKKNINKRVAKAKASGDNKKAHAIRRRSRSGKADT